MLILKPASHADDMEVDRKEEIVTPGQVITKDLAFMRGHGTFTLNEQLVASVAGKIERVNKLVSVKPLKTRFNGEIGDVVVGRIAELGNKRWRVDIQGRQEATLLLSSINLPGGVQRRKNEADEMEMRSFFAEGDMLSAEVQAFFGDGGCSLHTRSFKYGKLRNGCLVVAPSALIKRSKSHFISLSCGVDVVLGLNGYIWVQKHVFISPEMQNQPEGLYINENDEISMEEREAISRVCNIITALVNHKQMIYETIIVFMYENSLEYQPVELLSADLQKSLIDSAISQLEAAE
ncbi:exosome non-catalytic core subunit rrp4 [Boothiomyces macroporosus]|uniref:Exosome complex component RRP4 n=1 Tax=Boothiomyces macroporosus TaxID=261099 RepID=A0AAD5UM46_9FUNG|nr:exosome non-catalytic core subunit rrp4 [Boothiomyces macroporosus]